MYATEVEREMKREMNWVCREICCWFMLMGLW